MEARISIDLYGMDSKEELVDFFFAFCENIIKQDKIHLINAIEKQEDKLVLEIRQEPKYMN